MSLIDKLTSYTADFLINDNFELKKLIQLYNINVNQSDAIDFNFLISFESTIKHNMIISIIKSFHDMMIEKKKDEFLYYTASLYRKACEAKNICLSNLYYIEQRKDQIDLLNSEPEHKGETNFLKKKYFKVIDIEKNKIIKEKTDRNSFFRGVSKTGSKWQALLMNKQRYYLGSFDNEEQAARQYDKYAIYFFEDKAKTNFTYTKEKRMEIIEKLKNKNIIM